MVYEPVNIKDHVNDVINLFKFRAKIRKIDLIQEIDPEISELFNTEPRRLKQILLNLMGNAMKFTFHGYIKIIAKLQTIQEQQCIKIIVEDTGIGIKKDLQGKIFNLFEMVDTKR